MNTDPRITRLIRAVDAASAVQNKLVTLHLAILALAETTADPDGRINSIERVFDEALRDLDRGLKLDEPAELAA